jgi:hypothetical protein
VSISTYVGGDGYLVGYSGPGASIDGGASDLSALASISLAATDTGALALTNNGQPVIGSAAFGYTINEVPGLIPFAFLFFGTGAFNPGIDLTPIGMPGCASYTTADLASLTAAATGGTATVPFPIPLNNALAGLALAGCSLIEDYISSPPKTPLPGERRSMIRAEERVRPDLEAWGFNSVGWNQDMASNGVTNHRQSRLFTHEEYQWLGLPYAPMLPFADFHHWDAEHRKPDFFSNEFADWCDYVAREYVAPGADDPKLIGYFYVDCPAWVHDHPHSRWRGPLFDYKKLESEAGRAELTALATKYYQTVHDAIRRYDARHLILGDRYEGMGRMAAEVLLAAGPYVDVISFQHFGPVERTERDLRHWAGVTGKPVLLADSNSGGAPLMRVLPDCIGYHTCGSYVKNKIRGGALLDAREQPIGEAVNAATATNRATLAWLRRFGG